MGTVLLGMTEEQFWKCTPRKLIALFDVHVKINSTEEAGENAVPAAGRQADAVNALMSW